ncbi:MAG: hypothetical protein QNJ47_05935 [Nostocaceae cyanobacterium]|nr:hypothetical protein [Nostocaceae cyanobacterium]
MLTPFLSIFSRKIIHVIPVFDAIVEKSEFGVRVTIISPKQLKALSCRSN